MKKNLLLTLAIGMAFVACKKENTENTPNENNEIEIYGNFYTIDYLKERMGREIGVTSDSLIYHREDTTFTVVGYPISRWSAVRMFTKHD